MKLILSAALSVVARFAARALSFSSYAWEVVKQAVAQAESAYDIAPGKGPEKYKLALSLILEAGLNISPRWAGIMVELAWLLYTATGWPKGGGK